MNLFNQYFVFLGGMPLPVAPEKIEITTPNLNKTLTLVDFSEINVLRPQGLQEIKFDMLLPSYNYPFVNPLSGIGSGSVKTGVMLANLKRMKSKAQPIRLIISRCRGNKLSWWTNLQVSIEDYSVNEDANNGTDVVVSLVLKEYKPYATKKAVVTKNPDGSVTAKFVNPREAALKELASNVVKDGVGKTLYNVMKTKLGTTNMDVFNKLKSLNGGIKNTIETAKEIKLQ